MIRAECVRNGRQSASSQLAFFGVTALLFMGSTAMTIRMCTSMPGMGEMPMPGGWTMSMPWMLMPGQSWLEAAAPFLGMWTVMMVAMMLPSLTPMLIRYRHAVSETREPRLALLTTLVAAGYFLVWTALGAAVFPIGVALASAEMKFSALARAVPIAVAAVVLIVGLLQFTRWKANHLAACRSASPRCGSAPHSVASALRHGFHLGLHCSYCCASLMSIVLVIGIMDLRAMALVTAAITLERVAPDGERSARFIGAILVGTGLVLTMRAVGVI